MPAILVLAVFSTVFINPDINILYGTIEKLRSMVKVCFINDTYQKVLSIPKIYFMMRQNIDSFNIFEEKSLNSNFLTWTGLRHAVPLNLHTNPHSFTVTLDLENFKSRNYYSLLIKFKHQESMESRKTIEQIKIYFSNQHS